MPLWLGYSVLALLLWGATGITQKLSTNRISSERSFLWFAWAMVAISIVVFTFTHIQWHLKSQTIIFAVVGGALNGLGALTSFRALEGGGKASVVISLISLFPLLTIFLAVSFLHEHLTWMQAVGAGIAIVAAILLSLEPPPKPA